MALLVWTDLILQLPILYTPFKLPIQNDAKPSYSHTTHCNQPPHSWKHLCTSRNFKLHFSPSPWNPHLIHVHQSSLRWKALTTIIQKPISVLILFFSLLCLHIFSIIFWMALFEGIVPTYKTLFEGIVPTYNALFKDTVLHQMAKEWDSVWNEYLSQRPNLRKETSTIENGCSTIRHNLNPIDRDHYFHPKIRNGGGAELRKPRPCISR